MRVLHTVEYYAPSVGGAQEVVRQLSERLAARGHDVTVATTALPARGGRRTLNGVRLEEFAITGNAVHGVRGERERYQRFLVESEFDLVMNYAAQEWAADLFFEVMDDVRGRKVFVPCGYSGLYDSLYRDYFRRMPDILRRYDATVYLSESYRDLRFARANAIGNTHVIPNAASEEEFGEISPAALMEFRGRHAIEGLLLVTVGTHTNLKGHLECVEAFLDARIGRATLMIVANGKGNCLTRCRLAARLAGLRSGFRKRVVVADLPRRDVVHALAAADISLLLSQVEASPLVLFESAAAGTPFIASSAGNAAEIAAWTGGGFVAESTTSRDGMVHASIDSAARHIERLAASDSLRRELGERARRAWRERFTWGAIADRYLQLYESLVPPRANLEAAH